MVSRTRFPQAFFWPGEKLYNVPFVAHEEQCRGHFADTVVGAVDPSTDGKAGVSAPEIPQPLAADMNDAGSYIFFLYLHAYLWIANKNLSDHARHHKKIKKKT